MFTIMLETAEEMRAKSEAALSDYINKTVEKLSTNFKLSLGHTRCTDHINHRVVFNAKCVTPPFCSLANEATLFGYAFDKFSQLLSEAGYTCEYDLYCNSVRAKGEKTAQVTISW